MIAGAQVLQSMGGILPGFQFSWRISDNFLQVKNIFSSFFPSPMKMAWNQLRLFSFQEWGPVVTRGSSHNPDDHDNYIDIEFHGKTIDIGPIWKLQITIIGLILFFNHCLLDNRVLGKISSSWQRSCFTLQWLDFRSTTKRETRFYQIFPLYEIGNF